MALALALPFPLYVFSVTGSATPVRLGKVRTLRAARRTYRGPAQRAGFLPILIAVGVLLAGSNPHSAFAHPSDFETLTLDLIVGTHGLQSIDAAVVVSSGPGYEPFPSTELKRNVAKRVLSALGLPDSAVDIDASHSERYHEVGFFVSLGDYQSGRRSILNLGTQVLQEISDDLGLVRLKVSVCGIDADVFSALEITGSQPGRMPFDDRQERAPCHVWDVEPGKSPVRITVGSKSLASPGFSAARLVVGSTAVVLLGLVAIAAGRLAIASRRRGF